MIYDDSTAGQTYELYGPQRFTMAKLAELVDKEILKERRAINIPPSIMKPLADIFNKFLWWPVGCADQVEREFIDHVIDPHAKTFKDLGIEPDAVTDLTYHYLVSEPAHLCGAYLCRSPVLSLHRICVSFLKPPLLTNHFASSLLLPLYPFSSSVNTVTRATTISRP